MIIEGIIAQCSAGVQGLNDWLVQWKAEGMPGGLGALEGQLMNRLAKMEKQWLKEALNDCGTGYQGSYTTCIWCGRLAKYKRNLSKRVNTMQHEQLIERAYYYCCRCGKGFCPLDQKLNIECEEVSPTLRRVLVELAAEIPFERVAKYIWMMRRICISNDSVLRYTHKAGDEVQKWRTAKQCKEELLGYQTSFNSEREEVPLYASADALSINIRGEGWKQPKIGVVFEMGKERILRRRNIAGFWGTDEFGHCWRRAGMELQGQRIAQWVSINDGADWIWKIVGEIFPRAIQIVDWYHAKERLYTIGRLVFGEGTKNAQQWSKQVETFLWNAQVDKVVEQIQKLQVRDKQIKQYAQQSVGYYKTHEHRMEYLYYRKQGLQIGSGVVEGGGCKNIVAVRFKRSGMRWSKKGAHQTLQVRASLLDETLNDFWKHCYAIN